MTAAPDMRPASAPIPSQLRTAVKLIMPRPAEASARKPMPTTAATGLRFKPRMAARNILPTVPPNAKRLIPIIAETAMRSLRLTAASRFTETASQSAKWLIRTTVITKMLFLYPQMPFVLLIIPTARPNVHPLSVRKLGMINTQPMSEHPFQTLSYLSGQCNFRKQI